MPPGRRVPNVVDGYGVASSSAGVLVLHLMLGCGGGSASRDATMGEPEAGRDAAEAFKAGVDANGPAGLDARIGIAGGNPCDASAQCLSGACTLGLCSDWAHVMRIGIDTTPSGVDIEEAVTSFPLLVRLDAGNFAFKEANPDGSDIRFSDSSGDDLPFEIERWNPALARAEIWVLVPRIVGGSSDNVVLMYWGNPLAGSTSSGPSVFADQTCVLHMNQNPNGSDLEIADASGTSNNGSLQAKPGSSALRAEGVAGVGLILDGGEFLATPAQIQSPQIFSVSLWFRTSGVTGGGIASFDANQRDNSTPYDRTIEMDASGRLSFSVMRGGNFSMISTPSSYNDGTWHFVAARLSKSGQFLFVDGEPAAGDTTTTGADTYFGYWRFGETPSNYFSGTIDEARVATTAQSDAWIRLSFATQRQSAPAVTYQR